MLLVNAILIGIGCFWWFIVLLFGELVDDGSDVDFIDCFELIWFDRDLLKGVLVISVGDVVVLFVCVFGLFLFVVFFELFWVWLVRCCSIWVWVTRCCSVCVAWVVGASLFWCWWCWLLLVWLGGGWRGAWFVLCVLLSRLLVGWLVVI